MEIWPLNYCYCQKASICQEALTLPLEWQLMGTVRKFLRSTAVSWNALKNHLLQCCRLPSSGAVSLSFAGPALPVAESASITCNTHIGLFSCWTLIYYIYNVSVLLYSLWWVRSELELKPLPCSWHVCCISSVCALWWVRRYELQLKLRPHSLHLQGLSPGWTLNEDSHWRSPIHPLTCHTNPSKFKFQTLDYNVVFLGIWRSEFRLKPLPHSSHLHGFSLVWSLWHKWK